jgi:ribonucleotide reductase alpha subunit
VWQKYKRTATAGSEHIQTALEIHPDWHLRHQLTFQQFTDNAVSKLLTSRNSYGKGYR